MNSRLKKSANMAVDEEEESSKMPDTHNSKHLIRTSTQLSIYNFEYDSSNLRNKIVVNSSNAEDTYKLPLKAKLIVPAGLFKKKEFVICEVTVPTNRWCTLPPMTFDEMLISEIYLLTSSHTTSIKKTIKILIPFTVIDTRYFEIKVHARWTKENDWTNAKFSIKNEEWNNYAEINLNSFGTLAVTAIPKKEHFQLTPSGCFYYSHMCRYISIRCPRTSVQETLNCTLQIRPISLEILNYCKQNYSIRCEDILECSEIIDIKCDREQHFRRPATVKFPLPNAECSSCDRKLDDIGVLMNTSIDNDWIFMENDYRLTKNTVSFEVKSFARNCRYCVLQSTSGRKKRLKDGIRLIEDKIDIVVGTIALFVRFEEMLWSVVVSCHSLVNSEKFENKWKERRFIQIQSKTLKEPEKTTQFKTSGKPFTYFRFNGPELRNNQTWSILIDGLKKVSDDDDEDIQLTYNRGLDENNKIFYVQPFGNKIEGLVGQIQVIPQNIYDEEMRIRLTGLFTVEVSADIVETYTKMVAIEKVRLEKLKELETTIVVTVPAAPIAPAAKVKHVSTIKSRIYQQKSNRVFDFLSRSVQRIQIASRTPNVLSGHSLMHLSSILPDVICLAVYMGVSDSSISGIGFDAFASGLTSKEVNYKILHFWKRNCPYSYEQAVKQLVEALKANGYDHIAKVILKRHAENKELTAECLAF